jgi:hypothetical protein
MQPDKVGYTYNCLICGNLHTVDSLQAISASEHMCSSCLKLKPESQALVVARRQNREN